jgi:hypothetical protein
MLSTVIPGVSPAQLRTARRLERILRNARLAQVSNPRNVGLASGVTVTDNGATRPAVTGATSYPISASDPGIWTVRGGVPIAATGAYRVKSATIGATGGNIGLNNGAQGSAWRASLMGDCRYIAFRVLPSTAPYRILVDGKYVSTAGTLLATTTGSTHQFILLDMGSRALRRLTLEGQRDNALLTAYTEATGALWPLAKADEVNIAWLGDSYVYGSAATANGDGLSPVAGDWLGAAMLASGSGGTGWVADNGGSNYRFDQRIANGDLALGGASPDAILLMASVNDRALDTATTTANALAGLRSARSLYPGVPIVVFGCAGASYVASVLATEAAVQAAVTAFSDPLCAFVPVSSEAAGAWASGSGKVGATASDGNSDWVTTADGTHPGDEGCAYLGRRYADGALKALTAMYAGVVG